MNKTDLRLLKFVSIPEKARLDFDPTKAKMHFDSGRLQIFYNEQVIQSQEGNYHEVANGGEVLRILEIANPDNYLMAYDSAGDYYVLGPEAKRIFKSNQPIIKVVLAHEYHHRIYLSLTKKEQIQVAEIFLGASFKNLLEEFLFTLYSDDFDMGDGVTFGEFYLKCHQIDCDLSSDLFIGVKDDRLMEIDFCGQRKKIFTYWVIGELFAFLSEAQQDFEARKSIFDYMSNKRGRNDHRLVAIEKIYKKLQKKPIYLQRLKDFGLFLPPPIVLCDAVKEILEK